MNAEDNNMILTSPEQELADLEYYCQECMSDFTVDQLEIDQIVRNVDFGLDGEG